MKAILFGIALMAAPVLLAQSAQNAKMKIISIPKYNFTGEFPKEGKLSKEGADFVRYAFEMHDTGGKFIGSATFTLLPTFGNWDTKEMLEQVYADIKSYKMGDECKIESTESSVARGIYHQTLVKSRYYFKDKDWTMGREDYYVRTCEGAYSFMYLIPSYNCYLTEYDRQYLVRYTPVWLNAPTEYPKLGISYQTNKSVHQLEIPKDNPKRLEFVPACVENLRNQLSFEPLDDKATSTLEAVRDRLMSADKANPKNTAFEAHKAEFSLKKPKAAYRYKLPDPLKSGEYLKQWVYVFKVGEVYYKGVATMSDTDLDGTLESMLREAEKLFDSIEPLKASVKPQETVKPQESVKPQQTEDDYEGQDWGG